MFRLVALALAASAASALTFGQSLLGAAKASKAPTSPKFEDMPGKFGEVAITTGLAQRLNSIPDFASYVREAELKHARIAMIAALGFPVAELWHPLFGGAIVEPSLTAFQASPLETFWPIVVGAIGLTEAASAITTFENPAEDGGRFWRLKADHVNGDLGFDPLGYSKVADLREEELQVGRLAMLGITGMVLQELATHAGLFTFLETK
mmetsp:Transcript_7289/g.30222  ORF Transcript_7289/g.30222 Transcript_7289/m.30222 type:complete len:208 (+) Transcript_7289:72-695(+)